MAKKYTTKSGKKITLLNPSEKANKYVVELNYNRKLTNEHTLKTDKKGNLIKLDKVQKAYRAGYLDARKDNAKCYKSKIKSKKSKF